MCQQKPRSSGKLEPQALTFYKAGRDLEELCVLSQHPSPPLCCVRVSLTSWEEKFDTNYHLPYKCMLFFVFSQIWAPLYFRIVIKKQRWKELSFSEAHFSKLWKWRQFIIMPCKPNMEGTCEILFRWSKFKCRCYLKVVILFTVWNILLGLINRNIFDRLIEALAQVQRWVFI